MVVGGHEDHSGARRILREFVRLSGGFAARIAVVATAAEDPAAAAAAYVDAFASLGAPARAVRVADRREAGDFAVADLLRQATGIFFTGGDQLRITAMLGGTPCEAALRQAHGAGAVVAGTSAGASAMSSTMIVGGRSDASPRREVVRMSPGLGLLPELVIDQHFAQRGRLSRLLAALAQNPGLLGVGVDEDTAFVVDGDGVLRVVGSATVTVLDGRGVRLSTASEADLDQSLTLTGVVLHVLSDGYRFDIRARRPYPPAPEGAE
ncbi:MAG: cyanophycinase [Firmicutes bacterium]|nr:cyanophycinase [Bacillota bacterium]